MGLLVFYILLRGEDLASIRGYLREVNYFYLALGGLVAMFFIVGESINIRELLTIFGYEIGLGKTLKYGFTGFFFSSITPSSAGGQPMQIYEMKKDNIELSHSSLVLLIELVIYQFVTIIYGSISYIYARTRGFIDSRIINTMVILGIIINLLVMSFILISIFNPRISKSLCSFIARLLEKLPMKEDVRTRLLDSLDSQIGEYNKCSKYILENKSSLLRVFLVTILQIGSLFTVSYLVYLALGFSERVFLEIIIIQSLIYIISTFIPIPGSIGVSEGNFLSLFSRIYSRKFLKIGLVLTRGLSFYGLLLVSMVSLSLYRLMD